MLKRQEKRKLWENTRYADYTHKREKSLITSIDKYKGYNIYLLPIIMSI